MESSKNSRTSHPDQKSFRNYLKTFQTFLNYFFEEHNISPWTALVGPGGSQEYDFTLPHLWYLFIISFIPVCSLLSNVSIIRPYIASDSGLCSWKANQQYCESIIVFFITYRISFAIAAFFLFTTILLTQAKRDSQYSATSLHNGFWIEKILMVLIISCMSFAFPPSTFDRFWICLVLISDILVSILQMCLIRDATKYLQRKFKKMEKLKKKQNQISLVLFSGMAISTFMTFSFASLTIYKITIAPTLINILTALFSLSVLLVLLFYTAILRREEFFSAVYIISYCSLLLYKAVTYRLSMEIAHKNNVIDTDISKLISILILYTTIIYALVRKDHVSYFFYYNWLLCRQHTFIKRINVHSNQMRRKPNNPNETLLDITQEILNNNERKEAALLVSPMHQIKYSEAFTHCVLLLVSLKSTSLVTDYLEMKDEPEGLYLDKSMSASITLHMTSICIPLLYGWFMFVECRMIDKINPLALTSLIWSFFQLICHYLYWIFIKTPKCFKKTTLSRYVYVIFFLTTFVVACIGLSPFFRRFVETTFIFCDQVGSLGACMSKDPAFIGLYRIYATSGLFYFILAILLFNVKTISESRDTIHNGCWLSKLLLLLLLFTLFVLIPSRYSRVWLYASLFATFSFSIIQLVCLLDVIDIVNTSWTETTKMSPTTIYYSSTSLTTFLYVISTAAFVCFYVYFAHNFNCKVNRVFISINLVICIVASIISIHPIIKSGGLLRSAIVTSFCMYLTWSALNYDPNEKCNPLGHTIIMLDPKPTRDAASVMDLFFLLITLIYFTIRIEFISSNIKELYPKYLFQFKCFKITKDEEQAGTSKPHKYLADNSVGDFGDYNDADGIEPREKTFHDRILFGTYCCRKHIFTDIKCKPIEDTKLTYSYTCLHIVLYLATSYSFALLTHWLEPVPGSGFKTSIHWAIMSVKMVASSTCALLYVWYIISPTFKVMYFKSQNS